MTPAPPAQPRWTLRRPRLGSCSTRTPTWPVPCTTCTSQETVAEEEGAEETVIRTFPAAIWSPPGRHFTCWPAPTRRCPPPLPTPLHLPPRRWTSTGRVVEAATSNLRTKLWCKDNESFIYCIRHFIYYLFSLSLLSFTSILLLFFLYYFYCFLTHTHTHTLQPRRHTEKWPAAMATILATRTTKEGHFGSGESFRRAFERVPTSLRPLHSPFLNWYGIEKRDKRFQLIEK